MSPKLYPAFTVLFHHALLWYFYMLIQWFSNAFPSYLKKHIPSLQEHHLALRSEGVKMIVDSQRPHFVGVDPDILSTGLVFYYLKVHLMLIIIMNTKEHMH